MKTLNYDWLFTDCH